MNRLQEQLTKAGNSSWRLWWLNRGLWRMVPFNGPHKPSITAITDDGITLTVRNTRRNRNHIGGVHACLLATLCEYATGLSLLSRLSAAEYRIILKNIHMTYHYQARMDVTATFSISAGQVEEEILKPLQTSDRVFREYAVDVYDLEGHHICTGLVNWQIKRWKNVKTSVG